MRHYAILLIGCLIFSFGCKEEGTSTSDFIKWVENDKNGLKVSKQFENFIVTTQYKPLPYQALRQLKQVNPPRNQFKKEMEELDGLEYFNLVIRLANNNGDVLKEKINSENDYYQRIKYFSFEIQKDLVLKYGNGATKPCVFSHFERNFGISSAITITMAFESENIQSDKTLEFNDKVLGLGKIELQISEHSINNIPNLVLN